MNLCTVFVFLSLIEIAVVNKIVSGDLGPALEARLGRAFSIRRGADDSSHHSEAGGRRRDGTEEELKRCLNRRTRWMRHNRRKIAKYVDRTSRAAFPVLFFILLSAYWMACAMNAGS